MSEKFLPERRVITYHENSSCVDGFSLWRDSAANITQTSLARLDEPMTALSALKGIVVIDEIQRRPDLLRQSSETLAGRIEMIEMTGFPLFLRAQARRAFPGARISYRHF